MVDSGTNIGYCMQRRPEEETVMLLKNDVRRLPNSNKRNDKQINDDNANVTFQKHQNNCDNLREKAATNDDKNSNNGAGGVNGSNGDGDDKAPNKRAGDDLFADDLDEDPYAELQSYLDRVKVSVSTIFLHNLSKNEKKNVLNMKDDMI